MKSREKSPDRREIADRLHSAAIHLLRHVRRQDAHSGIGPAQFSALSVLVFGGPMTLGQLAAAEQVKPPTMTRILTGLERNRLAERVRDPVDARRLQVRATAKGARLLHEGRLRRINYLAEHFSELSAKELALLNEAAEIVHRALTTAPINGD